MLKSNLRILTTHTGSLPRPAPLVELYARRALQEPINEQALNLMGREAMRESVFRQIDCGLDVINNGEQQREGFFLYVQRKLSGFGGAWKRWPRADVERYPIFKQALESASSGKVAVSNFAPPKVVGEVKYLDPASASDEAVQFRTALGEVEGRYAEAFLTAPSPGIIAAACFNEHYDSDRAYFRALGEALRHEYEAIVAQGFILQLDCPDLALERHVSFHASQDTEFLKFAELVVETLNDALRSIPPEKVRMHVCWGNYEGPHDCDIDLHTIWPIIRQTRVGGFVLPFANARHAHEMRVLREQPLKDDQVIVAGVIDVLTNFVEHPEVVAQRLELMARELGDPTRVLAGTDCGFDTSAGMGRVAADVVWAKLRSLRDGAHLASQRLFH